MGNDMGKSSCRQPNYGYHQSRRNERHIKRRAVINRHYAKQQRAEAKSDIEAQIDEMIDDLIEAYEIIESSMQ